MIYLRNAINGSQIWETSRSRGNHLWDRTAVLWRLLLGIVAIVCAAAAPDRLSSTRPCFPRNESQVKSDCTHPFLPLSVTHLRSPNMGAVDGLPASHPLRCTAQQNLVTYRQCPRSPQSGTGGKVTPPPSAAACNYCDTRPRDAAGRP